MPKKEIRLGNMENVDKIMRFAYLFIALSVCTVFLQGVFIYFVNIKNIKLSIMEIFATIATCLISFIFICTQTLEILKYRKIKKQVKSNGVAVDRNFIYMLAKKNTLGNAVKLLLNAMLTLSLVLCFGFATYTIFDFSYNRQLNFYLPMLVLFAVTTAFSVKYLDCLTEM